MSPFSISLFLLVLAVAGFVFGYAKARAMRASGKTMHSLSNYYGWYVFLGTLLPSLIICLVLSLFAPSWIESQSFRDLRAANADDVMHEQEVVAVQMARGVASSDTDLSLDEWFSGSQEDVEARLKDNGIILATEPSAGAFQAAKANIIATKSANRAITVISILAAFIGGGVAYFQIKPTLRARNRVETIIVGVLILAASVAILTTIGIVLSLFFNSVEFFQSYPWREFFFSTKWAPNFRGNSSLGILPLLWGTLYISLIALLVAVPIGLLSAIYMSEYATRRVRNFVKPALEVLAGIPTIVYGLFALLTVGPLVRAWIAEPTGWGNSDSNVLTAGFVMGIMLIPFVSSLSDDIINAVPQALRDGSYGMGATKSETIKLVVIPAALPGIVGAVLLAASRAIGETMIVVLGAGALAQISPNPLEAMTTVTVKIVSQLTGDTDFASPETLVAFALGLTLFVITLGLNVVALIIVRKYREQYE